MTVVFVMDWEVEDDWIRLDVSGVHVDAVGCILSPTVLNANTSIEIFSILEFGST